MLKSLIESAQGGQRLVASSPHYSTSGGVCNTDKMSSSAKAKADICCANCGIAQVDEVKMEECNHCNHVLCGSELCRVVHRQKHKQEYKKRKVELHDDDLFRQPGSTHLGECPICFLPMPLEGGKWSFLPCCSSNICKGCIYAHCISSGNINCPFCREPPAEDGEKWDKRMMKRIKANDLAAMREMGTRLYHEGDYDKSFEYWTKAAELGDSEAHYYLSVMYRKGEGVEEDEGNAVYHCEKAAIGGHHQARYNLAYYEERNGNIERSAKHIIIAANLGYELSMKELWGHYSDGHITKEDLDATLRSHHAATDGMKSTQRDAAEASGAFST